MQALKGTPLLLDVFSLDLLAEAMRPAPRALSGHHRGVLGRRWFLAAITPHAVRIWRGSSKEGASETIDGLAATA